MKHKKELYRFYDQVGKKYPEEEVVYKTLRGKLRKKFVCRQLETFRGSLLDIGCNTAMYLNAYNRGNAFGVDLSPSVLLRVVPGKNVRLAVSDAEALCFRPCSFDHVLCSEVLEHCLAPRDVFSEIFCVLKSGGSALVTTPNYRHKRPVWIGLGTLKSYGVEDVCEKGYYHTAFQPRELEQLAVNAGFTIMDSGTLEKEVKYAAKLPALFLILAKSLNRIFHSDRFERASHRCFETLSLWIYHIVHYSGLEPLLLKLVSSGVRSYILVKAEK
ncbi:methyltransferase domain-containing protein [candidate division KSB1 bacterium]|nr:methyltransferase domain-containing protein [candidate division KSB1 bacterium]